MAIQGLVRGMRDELPDSTALTQLVERTMIEAAASYGYQEIRTPIVETSELFSKAVGLGTDIVDKEMYTFIDKSSASLTLRPEGTASCVRAGLQHGSFRHQIQRWYYSGPMFRRERPQKGRYRQFSQIGLEAFGMPGPELDVELILIAWEGFQALGLSGLVTLQLNSVGSVEARDRYVEALRAYFEKFRSELSPLSLDRLQRNPLRLLDSKSPEISMRLQHAPQLSSYLEPASVVHFAKVCTLLEANGVPYQLSPYLVRGLDYYNRTVFEWVTDALGAQGTVCAGGRYDDLVQLMGGCPTPAAGFAIGVDRCALLLKTHDPGGLAAVRRLTIAVVVHGVPDETAMAYAAQIRRGCPGITVIQYYGAQGVESQFKKAIRQAVDYALILNDRFLSHGEVLIKRLATGQQHVLPRETGLACLKEIIR